MWGLQWTSRHQIPRGSYQNRTTAVSRSKMNFRNPFSQKCVGYVPNNHLVEKANKCRILKSASKIWFHVEALWSTGRVIAKLDMLLQTRLLVPACRLKQKWKWIEVTVKSVMMTIDQLIGIDLWHFGPELRTGFQSIPQGMEFVNHGMGSRMIQLGWLQNLILQLAKRLPSHIGWIRFDWFYHVPGQ